ncbi:hypothetical protein LEMLEM_LOCUS11243 [Lemmus lemmus]
MIRSASWKPSFQRVTSESSRTQGTVKWPLAKSHLHTLHLIFTRTLRGILTRSFSV